MTTPVFAIMDALDEVALRAMRRDLGPKATLQDARARALWFQRLLSQFSNTEDQRLQWVPRGAPDAAVLAMAHPMRGVSVAYSWMHGTEALLVGSKPLGGLRSMWLHEGTVPDVLLPTMRILRRVLLLPAAATATAAAATATPPPHRKWRARASDVLDYIHYSDACRADFGDDAVGSAIHRNKVTLAIVSTAAWAVHAANPRLWPRDSKRNPKYAADSKTVYGDADGDDDIDEDGDGDAHGDAHGDVHITKTAAPIYVTQPNKWRLAAEWDPCAGSCADAFSFMVMHQRWPPDILSAAYKIYTMPQHGRQNAWRVRFQDARQLLDLAKQYADACVVAAVSVSSGSCAITWLPAAAMGKRVFAGHACPDMATVVFDSRHLGAVMRCSTVMACAMDFSWVLVCALVCAGVMDYTCENIANAACWGDVLVPCVHAGPTAAGSLVPGVAPFAALAPASLPVCPAGLVALSNMLMLSADIPRIVVLGHGGVGGSTGAGFGAGAGAGAGGTGAGAGARALPDDDVPFDFEALHWTRDDDHHDDERHAFATMSLKAVLAMLISKGSAASSMAGSAHNAARVAALAAVFMTPSVNVRWSFVDCAARQELQAVLALDLDAMFLRMESASTGDDFEFVSHQDAQLSSARDGWCVGSPVWLKRASSALWWWILTHCTAPGTELRACVCAAAELAYRRPAMEMLLLWGAFAQARCSKITHHGAVHKRQTSTSTMPMPPVHVQIMTEAHEPLQPANMAVNRSVLQLHAVDPYTLNPIVSVLDAKDPAVESALCAKHAFLETMTFLDAKMLHTVFHADWNTSVAVGEFMKLLAAPVTDQVSGPTMDGNAWTSALCVTQPPRWPTLAPLLGAAAAVVDATACSDVTTAAFTVDLLHPAALVATLCFRFASAVQSD